VNQEPVRQIHLHHSHDTQRMIGVRALQFDIGALDSGTAERGAIISVRSDGVDSECESDGL